MKKFIYFIFLLTIALVSCKKTSSGGGGKKGGNGNGGGGNSEKLEEVLMNAEYWTGNSCWINSTEVTKMYFKSQPSEEFSGYKLVIFEYDNDPEDLEYWSYKVTDDKNIFLIPEGEIEELKFVVKSSYTKDKIEIEKIYVNEEELGFPCGSIQFNSF